MHCTELFSFYSLVVSNTLASVHIFKPFVSSLLFIKCNVTAVYLLTITYYTRAYTHIKYIYYICCIFDRSKGIFHEV